MPSRRRPHRGKPTCERCGEELLWSTTVRGARQPLDPVPNPDGSVLAYKDITGWLSRSLSSAGGEDAPRHPLERIYMPHQATCAPRKPAQTVLPNNVTPLRKRRRS